jgi:hypothetical protein
MKKRTCLIFLAVACCCACLAQPASDGRDSTAVSDSTEAGNRLFIGFTAVLRTANKVVLRWDADSSTEGDFFIVERSPDGQHYETIGAFRSPGPGNHYELTDQAPPNGVDFYRIRYDAQTGRQYYSKTVALSLSSEVDFKFYPNPVDKLFIVRTTHCIDLQILDPAGIVRLSKRLQSGMQVINVSSLEHGVYIIRVTDKESNRSISEQMVKN